MMSIHGIRSLVLVGFSVLALQASAAEVSCGEIGKGEFESGFTELRDLAVATNARLCQSMLTIDSDHEQRFRATMLDFSSSARKILHQSFDTNKFKAVDQQFDYFELSVAGLKGDFNVDALERLNARGILDTELYFDRNDVRSTIGQNLDAACAQVAGSKKTYSGCEAAFKDVASGFNAYRDAYNEYRYSKNEEQLAVLSAQWDKFLTEARGQTLLDVLVTTWMHRDYYSQTKLIAPAATQYFLLRPQVVYEHAGGAPKGDKDNVALAIEWAGINWWNSKLPFGVSIVSVYVDAANQDSVATGLQFTLDNQYSFGVTRRGDETAVFLTLDLIKLFQEKRQQLERNKSMILTVDKWTK
ncbi:MAG: hypothetical protein WD002_02750 [Pseudomonadales bacterium]